MANFFATYPGTLAGSSSLPPGAATAANQLVEIGLLTTISGQLPATLGQKAMAASLAVVIASDQSAIPITAASLPLPTGAAAEATLAAMSAKLPATLGQHLASASLSVILASDQGAVPVSQSGAWSVSVSNFPATQPVSGTVTVNQGTANVVPWNENIAQIAGAVPSATNALPSRLSDGTSFYDARQIRALTSADTVTVVQPTGTNLHAVVDASALPTGAAISAKQPALGTAGTPSSDVITVQGIASMTAIKVDGSAVTQPVSGTVNAKAATPTAGTVTQAAISVGTTAVRLTVSGSAPSASRSVLAVTPDSASAANFYIGSSSVDITGADRGIQLVAGQTFIANSDAGDYYIISDVAAQDVFVMEQA